MARTDNVPSTPNRLSAADMRRRMAEIQLAKEAEADAKRRRLEEEHAAQLKEFLEGSVTDADLARIRTRATVAIENGQVEIEILRFSSDLLSDGGRALNNYEDGWPNTLRGKAAAYYALYLERAKPLGYKLNARILSYPGGMPGDVGMYLSWA